MEQRTLLYQPPYRTCFLFPRCQQIGTQRQTTLGKQTALDSRTKGLSKEAKGFL